MIEIEIQNETNQSQETVRFASVPRIGEGVRLKGPDGFWASFDVLDLWYQKAEFGEIWMPYLHVRMTEGERLDGVGEKLDLESDDDVLELKHPVTAVRDVPAANDEIAANAGQTGDDDDDGDEDSDSGSDAIEEWRMASLNP